MLADADGDKIFSTFDTRNRDQSQPDMNCGTHIITGGTGKYAGITGSEPFACNGLPALAGAGGYTSMDIPWLMSMPKLEQMRVANTEPTGLASARTSSYGASSRHRRSAVKRP